MYCEFPTALMRVHQQVQQLIYFNNTRHRNLQSHCQLQEGTDHYWWRLQGFEPDVRPTRSHFLGAAQSVPSALDWYPVGERQFSQETEETYNTIISSLTNSWNCQTVGGKVSSSKFSVTKPHDDHAATTAQEGSFRRELRTGLSGRRTYANSTLSKSKLEIARRKRVSNTLVYAQCHGEPDNVIIGVVVLLCVNKKLCSLKSNMLLCPYCKYQEQSIK